MTQNQLLQTWYKKTLDPNYESINKFYNVEEFVDEQRRKSYEHMFSLFQIDMEKALEEEFVLLKHLQLNPMTVDGMEYWRYHYLIKNYVAYLEKEKEERDKEEGKNNEMFNQKKMMSDAQKQMPKMDSGGGNYGGFKMPSMPKGFNI